MNQPPNVPMPDLKGQDPLAQLEDIRLPEAISAWPPAWGWWLLALIVIGTVWAVVFIVRRHRLRNAYRVSALLELDHIYKAFNPEKKSDYLQAISILLRRTAISGHGDYFDASIKGETWLSWLDAQNTKKSMRFSDTAGKALLIGPYQRAPEFDQLELYTLTKHWIQHHRNQWQQKAKTKIEMNEAVSHV
jgi:hypothetical protein